MLTTCLPDVLHHLQDALCPGVLHVNFCFCFQGVHFGSMYQAYARSCFHLGNTGCKIGDLDSQGSFVMVFPTSLPILSLPPEDPESFLNSDAPFAVLTQHLVTPGPNQCHPRRVLQVWSAETPLPPSSSGFGCNPPSWVPNPDSAPPLGASHHSPPWSSLPAMSPRLVPHPGSHPPSISAGPKRALSAVTTKLYSFSSTLTFQSKRHPCPLNCLWVPPLPRKDQYCFFSPGQSPQAWSSPGHLECLCSASQEHPDVSGHDGSGCSWGACSSSLVAPSTHSSA